MTAMSPFLVSGGWNIRNGIPRKRNAGTEHMTAPIEKKDTLTPNRLTNRSKRGRVKPKNSMMNLCSPLKSTLQEKVGLSSGGLLLFALLSGGIMTTALRAVEQ